MTKLKSFIICHLSFRKGKLARLIRLLDFGFYFIWSIGLWLFLSSLGATLMIFLKTTSDLCNRPSINKRAASSEYLKYKDSFPNSNRTALALWTFWLWAAQESTTLLDSIQVVQEPSPAQCRPASTTISASGEPGVTAPSVTPRRFPPQLQELRPPLVSALAVWPPPRPTPSAPSVPEWRLCQQPSGPMSAWATTWTLWPSSPAREPRELSMRTDSAGFFSTRLLPLKLPMLQPAPGQFPSKSVFILMEMMPLEPLLQRPTEMTLKMIQPPPLGLVLATADSTWPTGKILANFYCFYLFLIFM